VRCIGGSRWLRWSGLVVMPWLIRALAARTFEAPFVDERFYVVGGRRKYRKSNRCGAGWDETSREGSCREDGTAADVCRTTEDGSFVRTRTVRAVRWPFVWWRGQSTARCDEDRKTCQAYHVVGRHDLKPVAVWSSWSVKVICILHRKTSDAFGSYIERYQHKAGTIER